MGMFSKMKKISLLCATAALVTPVSTFAQSTGSIEFEEEAIVVTGTRTQEAGGVIVPDTPKAKQVLTQEIIERQRPGQTILETINLIPGVSFQNNDPYGSSGGTLYIRGFSSDRISLTFDGIPLNDTGNYAIYSNQQLDPEIIGEVSVNLGTTDVDSPTASAVGGTVNYRSRIPGTELGGMVSASYGEYDYHRVFGMLDTGSLTASGTRAFVSASYATNRAPYNGYGEVNKQQYNARLYQPIGDNGDFVSIAGHYNQNRNNFFGSVALRNDRDPPSGFPQTRDERFYTINYPCTLDTPQAGVADAPNTCGTEFDRRYNPSNTGNVRGSSRFTLSDDLILNIDPSFQYVKANGGGTVTGNEGPCLLLANARCGAGGTPIFGYVGGQPYAGIDLNGDGDLLDRVTVLAPSQTQTNRYGVIASLTYDINETNRVRVAYTFDHARHRQTGQVGLLNINGEPEDVFTINDPLIDVNGNVLQKRDRLSYAILHQASAEYRGEFLDNRLTVLLGLRAPFFTRELDQRCFTTSAGGFVDCFNGDPTQNDRYDAVTNVAPPQERTYKFDKLLPNVGFTFDFTNQISAFANYARGISVPSTDNLYNSLFFTGSAQPATARPELTDSFDLGLRYRSGKLQGFLSGWYTKFTDRTASAFDPELNETVFRNLGTVDKYGVDLSVSYEPIEDLVFYGFASWQDSEIKDDVVTGETAAGVPILAPTAGKRESGATDWLIGGRVQAALGPVELGAQVKYTGERYIYDTNLPVLALVSGNTVELFPATADAYTTVDLDARFSLERWGLEKTFVQVNVTNLFDELYVGGFGGGLSQTINRNAAGTITGYGNPPFVQIGAPRTISATLVVGF